MTTFRPRGSLTDFLVGDDGTTVVSEPTTILVDHAVRRRRALRHVAAVVLALALSAAVGFGLVFGAMVGFRTGLEATFTKKEARP